MDETDAASTMAGMDEKAKPRTGMKSHMPASSASSSAAGTFRMLMATKTKSPANNDVRTLPAT